MRCVALLSILLSLTAAAQEPKLYTIAGFAFEYGGAVENMRVAYDTYGEPNAARDNAILVTHGASQGRNGYKIFGSGLACRPSRCRSGYVPR